MTTQPLTLRVPRDLPPNGICRVQVVAPKLEPFHITLNIAPANLRQLARLKGEIHFVFTGGGRPDRTFTYTDGAPS